MLVTTGDWTLNGPGVSGSVTALLFKGSQRMLTLGSLLDGGRDTTGKQISVYRTLKSLQRRERSVASARNMDVVNSADVILLRMHGGRVGEWLGFGCSKMKFGRLSKVLYVRCVVCG